MFGGGCGGLKGGYSVCCLGGGCRGLEGGAGVKVFIVWGGGGGGRVLVVTTSLTLFARATNKLLPTLDCTRARSFALLRLRFARHRAPCA
jgi:hypothetical protein